MNLSFQSSSAIKLMQEQKLQELLAYLKTNSSFYKELFEKNDIDINEIKAIEDLSRIPPTEKEHLQTENEKFLCVPKGQIIEYTSTSGTIGRPFPDTSHGERTFANRE